MRYRTHQGERLSEIGVGCYGLSGAYGQKDPAEYIRTLRRAHELGVTFFDTADVYGPAEEVLGEAVAPFRDEVWIATKVGARADGKPDCSLENVRASCEASLRRLDIDVIDLYQIHFDDPATAVEETAAALEGLKAAGKIRHYGVGHLPLPRLQAFLQAGRPFSELLEFNVVARKAQEQVIPLCREHDVAVLAFSVTGRGLLTGAIGPNPSFEEGDIRNVDPLFQRERLASGLRVTERLREIGQRHGKTPAQMAIAWALAQPGIVCALTGPSTIPHLEENLGAAGWEFPPDALAELEQFLHGEEEGLRDQQVQNVRALLERPLDPPSAFTDLVYLLETLVEVGVADESTILPLFHRLLGGRTQEREAAQVHMSAIQAELRETFLPQLNDSQV